MNECTGSSTHSVLPLLCLYAHLATAAPVLLCRLFSKNGKADHDPSTPAGHGHH